MPFVTSGCTIAGMIYVTARIDWQLAPVALQRHAAPFCSLWPHLVCAVDERGQGLKASAHVSGARSAGRRPGCQGVRTGRIREQQRFVRHTRACGDKSSRLH